MKDRKQYYKEYREKNKEKFDAYQKKYREENREREAARQKAWKKENKERVASSQKEYALENRDKLTKYQRERARNEPGFRLQRNLRTRLWHALKLGIGEKCGSTLELTGCSLEDLISHLESQFTDGMTWDNYGKWHVDHIKPCTRFDLSLDTEQKACFHYSNLQPLWASDNLSKSDKYEKTK